MARIWKAIQRLDAHVAPPAAAEVAPKTKPSRKSAKTEDVAPTARAARKKAIVLDMLKRPDGATLKDIMDATSWQAHSVLDFILRKSGPGRRGA